MDAYHLWNARSKALGEKSVYVYLGDQAGVPCPLNIAMQCSADKKVRNHCPSGMLFEKLFSKVHLECLLISVIFSLDMGIISLAFALTGWVGDNRRLLLFPGSFLCYTMNFGIWLYLLSDMTAGGCCIITVCLKTVFSIPIKFFFFKRIRMAHYEMWQTHIILKYMLIKRAYFQLFEASHNVKRNKSMENAKVAKSHIGSGVQNCMLEIYAAFSAASVPVA